MTITGPLASVTARVALDQRSKTLPLGTNQIGLSGSLRRRLGASIYDPVILGSATAEPLAIAKGGKPALAHWSPESGPRLFPGEAEGSRNSARARPRFARPPHTLWDSESVTRWLLAVPDGGLSIVLEVKIGPRKLREGRDLAHEVRSRQTPLGGGGAGTSDSPTTARPPSRVEPEREIERPGGATRRTRTIRSLSEWGRRALSRLGFQGRRFGMGLPTFWRCKREWRTRHNTVGLPGILQAALSASERLLAILWASPSAMLSFSRRKHDLPGRNDRQRLWS